MPKQGKVSIQLHDGSSYIIDRPVLNLISQLQLGVRQYILLKKTLDLQADTNKYTVEFWKVNLEESTFFIPQYAIHRPATVNFLNGKIYEPRTHSFVRNFFSEISGSMVHAGVFFGDMLPSFSQSVSGMVYAFEPVPENFLMAKLCVEENQLANVLLYNAALSNGYANLKINTKDPDDGHAGGASEIGETGIYCPTLPIDCLAATDIVLIQLDVEGHELIALQGASATIERCRPVVAIEDNNQNCNAFLLERNYELVGEIPGLSIWGPSENQSYIELTRKLIESPPA